MNNTGNYIALLLCGHTAFYDPPPTAGEEVYCRRCATYTLVKLASQEYSWQCPTCHIGRKFGSDIGAARNSGRRHQRRYHHVTVLRKGYETVEVIGPEGEGELSVAGERIEWVRDHQGLLRALLDKKIVSSSTLDSPH